MGNQADQIQLAISRLRAGDISARDEIMSVAYDRLRRLTRKMLRDFPRLRRWEETDDVFQNAVMRLHRALEHVTPTTTTDYFRLAALQIRRELIDMARHYFGPQGLGAHHDSNLGSFGSTTGIPARLDVADSSADCAKLAEWTQFHDEVDRLPPAEREVFDLVWYHGFSHSDAAKLLGVSERTIQRRWQQARLFLHAAMKETPKET